MLGCLIVSARYSVADTASLALAVVASPAARRTPAAEAAGCELGRIIVKVSGVWLCGRFPS